MVYSNRSGFIHKNGSSMFLIKRGTKGTVVNECLRDIVKSVPAGPVHSRLIGLSLRGKNSNGNLIGCHTRGVDRRLVTMRPFMNPPHTIPMIRPSRNLPYSLQVLSGNNRLKSIFVIKKTAALIDDANRKWGSS